MLDYNPAKEARLLQYNNASNEVLVDVTRYALDDDADEYIEMEYSTYLNLEPKTDYAMDPVNSSDVLNLKYYLSSRNNCLLEVGIPSSETEATNKAYVNSTTRDSETSMRAYMDMLARDSEVTMRTHYTAYFDNTNAEMGKISEKINSVHYAVERDINGIIANIIPSVVETMVLELVRENDMFIADLKTKFDSFTPQVVSIQKEILTKIPNSIKIAVEESTKERNIIINDLKAQLYNLNKQIELLDKEAGEGESENRRPKPHNSNLIYALTKNAYVSIESQTLERNGCIFQMSQCNKALSRNRKSLFLLAITADVF
ncbi:hypothetical protein FQA39_LY07933 [Lamprigera yunnana]|nr:hypothetical protein FQA39_LY07933 [Lamprigera yunnana]